MFVVQIPTVYMFSFQISTFKTLWKVQWDEKLLNFHLNNVLASTQVSCEDSRALSEKTRLIQFVDFLSSL